MPSNLLRRALRRSVLIAGAAAVVSCYAEDDKPRTPLGQMSADTRMPDRPAEALSAAAQSALARGNELYRAKKYEDALAAYREAAVASPHHAAPYFGIQMAANALGRRAVADSALRRIRALSPPVAGDSADPHALPPGHPST